MSRSRIETTEAGNVVVYDKNDNIKHEYFECICDSEEHMVRVNYFVDDEWPHGIEDEIYISVNLVTGGFWWRLSRAIKYLFGYDCIYGHKDCWTLKRPDAERFKALLEKYITSGYTRVE